MIRTLPPSPPYDTAMKIIALEPSRILLDPRRNFSRSGRPHDAERVDELAEELLRDGQMTPVEVYPLAWLADEERLDTPEARALGEARRAGKKKPDAYGLVSGYRRVSAALKLAEEGQTSDLWDGRLAAVLAPAGLTAEEIEDRNLLENVARETLTPIDEMVALSALTRPADEGGRGETLELATMRLHLRGGVQRARKLLRLRPLCEEGRDLVRQNHHDPELGITVDKAVSLAKFTADEQRSIIERAKDAAGRVTPKALNQILAPHQARQGQPYAPSGAALKRLEERLKRVRGEPHTLERNKLTEREAELLAGVVRLLMDREDHGLEPRLANLLKGGLAQ